MFACLLRVERLKISYSAHQLFCWVGAEGGGGGGRNSFMSRRRRETAGKEIIIKILSEQCNFSWILATTCMGEIY